MRGGENGDPKRDDDDGRQVTASASPVTITTDQNDKQVRPRETMMHALDEEPQVVGRRRRKRTDQWRIQLGLGSDRAPERAAYARLLQQYPYPTSPPPDEDDKVPQVPTTATTAPENRAADLDPLTAMWMEDQKQTDRLQQLDLEYRKEKARRKRRGGTTTKVVPEEELLDERELQAVALQIIDKDLARLPHPDQLHGTAVCTAFRKDILRQVLFLFSCWSSSSSSSSSSNNNNNSGYQQGMHEIASYVLYAAELEETPVNQDLYADTFALLQVILTQLLPAYDMVVVEQPKAAAADKPLEQMSQRILQQVAQHDPLLHQTWMSSSSLSSVPPQLIFTKWVRLLFSREVTNVLSLWDAIFLQMTATTQQALPLQQVAEAVAVARLLVHRAVLLEKHQQQADHHDSDLLHYLMNMPVEESITPLTDLLGPLLRGESVAPFLTPFVKTTTAATSSSNSRLLHASSSLSQAFQSMTTAVASNPTATTTTTSPITTTTPPHTMDGTPSRFSFTGLSHVKERLASQTHSIGKRLHQEWEHLHHTTDAAEQRNYDDPPMVRTINFHPPPPPDDDDDRLFEKHPHVIMKELSQQMQYPLTVLQQFAMQTQQQEGRPVPQQVWEALASLEMIRTELGR